MITQNSIARILDAVSVEDIVGEVVNLKRSGSSLKGLCPFHDEKTPSFMVSPAKGIYKCFGCGQGGDSVKFLMEHETMSYPEALKYIAKKYNIEIEEVHNENAAEEKEKADEREGLLLVNEFAKTYFQDQMHNTANGQNIALSYFKERGFRPEIIKLFELGYDPESGSTLHETAKDKGYDLKSLLATGLVKEKEGRYFDFFRGRVMFPIRNATGRVIAFGGRTLRNDKKTAKYFNSPESEVYNKSRTLYGLHLARKAISKNNQCFLCEGYTDVVSMYQAGIENVVASSGTSLTPDQIKQIKRYSENITILFDGDAAGIKASFRGIDLILEQGLNVKAVLFPEGEDPDSFAKKTPTNELEAYLTTEAKDFIHFKTDLLLKENKNDPTGRAKVLHEVVNSIALVPDHILRSLYIKQCSDIMGIEEMPLVSELNKARRKMYSKSNNISPADQYLLEEKEKAPAQTQKPEETINHQETDLMRLLLNYGDEMLIKKGKKGVEDEDMGIVAHVIMNELSADSIEFEYEGYKLIHATYKDHIAKETLPKIQHLISHSNELISKTAINLLSQKHHLSPNWKDSHKIYTTTEDMVLLLAVSNSITALKLKKVMQLSLQLDNKLKTLNDLEEIMPIMEQKKRIQEVQKLLSDQLGRIIVK